MNKNYRLRTQIGVDREIQVQLDQDWDTIEILSLKILQSEVYTRMCSDYGVVAGRVVANGGYGVPNVRVSIFVPISDVDQTDTVISTLYPYRQYGDKNEDGYRYNLLPYKPSHGGHTPTGTFPTLEDILTNQTVLEVYEKYYKFTVKTNESGDYMIFGAPLGNQTIVMDMDLSDIGPFSLSPQDLIRMGKATTDQISGTRFKTSTNLDELPQIVSYNENIDVSPFWGDEDICQVRIERVDFDLRALGIEITPTATFMGSLISGDDDNPLKQSCRPSLDGGDLCSLIATGQIIAIRQTPILDDDNRPYLEQYRLDNDGNVIDENGVYMLEIPMNLDYIITNEFGEQIISPNPSIGIPSSGKYRFKIKWQQSNEIGGEVRRAYFLVPNVREFGWTVSTDDPLQKSSTTPEYQSAKASYYFGVDWSGYTTNTTVAIDQRISDAINCVDTFYKFEYNKVYTTAQHIDQFSRGLTRSRFIGIKDITDSSCTSENNKFPTTDAVMSSDFFYFFVSILLTILFIPLLTVIYTAHILALIFPIVKYLIAFVFGTVAFVIGSITKFINWAFGTNIPVLSATDTFNSITKIKNPFVTIPLPMWSYPDCNACDCNAPSELGEGNLGNDAEKEYQQNSPSCSASFFNYDNYLITNTDSQKALAGVGSENAQQRVLRLRTPIYANVNTTVNTSNAVGALPIWERANLFNLKSKYFDTDVTNGSNRIKVIVEPTLNISNPNSYHNDNVMIYLVDNNCLKDFSKGKLLSFNSSYTFKDPNPIEPQTGTTVVGITGSVFSTNVLNVSWADPTGISLPNKTTSYTVPAIKPTETRYKFPTDVEYFQVITGMTVSQFTANTNYSTSILNYAERVLTNNEGNFTYQNNYEGFSGLGVVIMVRGVDPNSGKQKIRYNISRLLGETTYLPKYDIDGDFYLNVPIQSGSLAVRHNQVTQSSGSTINGRLYYPSFYFTPGTGYSSYTSNNHTTYSSLDYTQVNNYSIDPANINDSKLYPTMVIGSSTTPLLTTNVGVGPTSNGFVRAAGSTTNIGGYYFPQEYIEGGSFITNYNIISFPANLINDYKYFAPKYFSGNTLTVNKTYTVMRSDRLPTGDIFDTSGNNVFALQASNTLSLTFFTDEGLTSTSQTITFGIDIKTGDTDDFNTGATYNKVIESFSCAGMVDLDCYSGDGTNFGVKSPDNPCNKNGLIKKRKIVNNGCYSFVNEPITTIISDYLSLVQWLNRFRITFALCRGVIGHAFTNSWVNGTLYAYPFALETTYDSKNKPITRFCNQTIFLDNDTFNFYYRSSPYDGAYFIGKQIDEYVFKANEKFIQTPTTILDMGPKYFWSKEVSLSPNYYGYIMDQIPATSYQDVSDLSQLFAVSRLVNTGFLGKLVGAYTDKGVEALFSRRSTTQPLRVDGDYAQMIQINSQFGVNGFNNENYSQRASVSTSPIFVGSDSNGNALMGVFFSSDTQNRDYISPRRIIRNEMKTTLVADYLPINTQRVPFYLWSADSNTYIFGTQNNTWDTENDINDGYYQSLKRELSPFYQGSSSIVKFNPGFIFSATKTSTPTTFDYDPLNDSNNNNVDTLVSAPWYFYFGLKKGKTAIDKFYTTYIDKI